MIHSFLKQTPWRCGSFQFPPEPGVRWFNPSVVVWRGRILMAVRKAVNKPKPLGMNTIYLVELDKRLNVACQPQKIDFLRAYANEHFEDPRMVVLSNSLFVSACNFKIENYHAHQVLAQLDNNMKHPTVAHIEYGKNGINPNANTGNEKNWIWFDYENPANKIYPKAWCFVYDSWPHEVVYTDLGKFVKAFRRDTVGACPWAFGKMRGGTPPVLMGKRYWSFFHSSMERQKPTDPRRRYYMGAYSFERNPPFDIKSITLDPLLIGSEEDGGNTGDRGGPLPVIFPGGAIWSDGGWTVVFGVNDNTSAWIEIPHGELLDRMADV